MKSSMRGAFCAAFAFSMLLLTGCVSTMPLNYAPSSVMSASGAVQVKDFVYEPAKLGKVKPNQVRNTAMGNILFEKNVDVFFRDAVFAELRFVGVKVGNEGVQLNGDIQEFLIDDLGYSIDWTLRVRYVVRDAQGAVIYDQVKTTQRKTNKFANAFGALNETVKLNVEELVKDESFVKSINDKEPSPAG